MTFLWLRRLCLGLVLGLPLAAVHALTPADALALAAGEIDEEGLTRWIRDNWPKDAPA